MMADLIAWYNQSEAEKSMPPVVEGTDRSHQEHFGHNEAGYGEDAN